MFQRIRLSSMAACIVGSLTLCACGGKQVPIAGHPLAQSRDSDAGLLITKDQAGDIVAASVPSGEMHTLRERGSDPGYVHALAADGQGHVAFVVGRLRAKNWDLRMMNTDGSGERVIIERSGDPIWDQSLHPSTAVGHQIALAPGGTAVAMLSGGHQDQRPGALLFSGTVELINTADGASRMLGPALDEGLAFLPDGRLLVVDWIPAAQAAAQLSDADGFGELSKDWSEVPAVFIVDTATGNRRFLHVGEHPVPSVDRESVALGAWDKAGHWHQRVIHTHDGAVAGAPLERVNVAALLGDQTAIWLANPGPGDPTGRTQNYSPLVGPRQLLVAKLGRLGDTSAPTIMSGLDARNDLVFAPAVMPMRGAALGVVSEPSSAVSNAGRETVINAGPLRNEAVPARGMLNKLVVPASVSYILPAASLQRGQTIRYRAEAPASGSLWFEFGAKPGLSGSDLLVARLFQPAGVMVWECRGLPGGMPGAWVRMSDGEHVCAGRTLHLSPGEFELTLECECAEPRQIEPRLSGGGK